MEDDSFAPNQRDRSWLFGEPVAGIKADGSEEWTGGSKGKMYYLRIYYVSDTIASGYSIHYQYKAWFGSRDYLIDSLSIR
jgi:hypothetical protein